MLTLAIREFILSRTNINEALDCLTELELETSDESIVAYCEELREALASGAHKYQESEDVAHGA